LIVDWKWMHVENLELVRVLNYAWQFHPK
jgi:hypothetical protein